MQCHHRQISLLLLLGLAGLTMAVAPQGAFAKGPADGEEAANRRRMTVEEMWWNDPEIVNHLSLSEDQRENMDGQYRTYLEAIEAELVDATGAGRRA